WTDFSWLLARLTGGLSNFDQVMVYRLSLGALEALTLGLLWWLLRKRETGATAVGLAIYAWNPLVLFDLVGSAHNDIAMLALLLVGSTLMLSNRRASWPGGLVVITLGALVKYATGPVVLLGAVAWAARSGSWRPR